MKCHLLGCKRLATRLVEDDNNKIVFMCENDSSIFRQNGYTTYKISSFIKISLKTGILMGLIIAITQLIQSASNITPIGKIIIILFITYLVCYKGISGMKI